MKFEEALEKLTLLKKNKDPLFDGFDRSVGIAMAEVWNLLALAENKLDDLVLLDIHSNITSIPLEDLGKLKVEEEDVVETGEGNNEEPTQEPEEPEPADSEPATDDEGDDPATGEHQ